MGDDDVVVRVAEPLRFLLPLPDRASGERRLRFAPDATVGHLVRSAGVPLTETGPLLLDGVVVPVDARPQPGDVVEVPVAPRPQPVPGGGFLLDVGLGALARRLRLLGLDAAWSNEAEDAELAERAAAEHRALLTQDRGLLRRRVFGPDGGVVGALVRGSRVAHQLADVLDRFAPPLDPLTRCTACGGPLEETPKAAVEHLLEPGTRRSYEAFSRCTACGRVYWRGAHAHRIDELVRLAGGGRHAPTVIEG